MGIPHPPERAVPRGGHHRPGGDPARGRAVPLGDKDKGRHTMRIIRATHLGMCFGVRDAIALALASAEAGPLTILGDLVHNPTVLGALAARGIAVATDVAQVTTDTLMVTAHGAAARQSIEKVRPGGASIRRRFPRSDVRFLDTVCKPTKERQDAAVELARASDVVIVIGGETSNNTRELVKTCGRYCSRVHHVQTEADLSPAWFREAHTVGITAGTSTPDDAIDRVEGRVRTFGRGRGLDALDMAECAR